MPLYELIERPDLDEPLLVLALEGWIDAGLAAAGAAEALTDRLDTVTVARFSTDDLLDYRARRPLAHLTDGVLRGLTWPDVELRAAIDGEGNEMLLLVGAEPDRLWHRFTDEVVGLALDFGARMCVGLGAYPFAAPHTRPPRVACTASTPALAEGAFLKASLDFPGGIQAAIEQGCDERGIPAVGLWAQIPHYVPTNMPFPAGSVALVESLSLLGDLSLPLGDLSARADATRRRLDELIAQNPEHVAMLHQLEAAWDQSEPADEPIAITDLPTGDELVAELEDFLRDQRPD
ncbi:MAG TPA: PAC2 family protein [Acidimicrobiales bacterium]